MIILLIIIAVIIGWVSLALLSFPFMVKDTCEKCSCKGSCYGDIDIGSCPEPHFKAFFAPFTLSCMFLWRCVIKPPTRFISRWQGSRVEKYGIKIKEKKKKEIDILKMKVKELGVENKALMKRIRELNEYKREEILDLE